MPGDQRPPGLQPYDPIGPEPDQPTGRKGAKANRLRARAHAREARWEANRYAVPYRTDGPRITFGLIWFGLACASGFFSPLLLALLASMVAALAALQTANAWVPDQSAARWWAAGAGFVGGLGGFLGPLGLTAGLGVATALCLAYGVAFPSRNLSVGDLVSILVRASVPVGLAAGSMAALALIQPGAFLTLLVLISAYEIGDFLVGSGANNAVEGPVSGIIGLGSVVFILWILVPPPFNQEGMLLFGLLAALSCPLGQIVASAILPKGSAWAPALRRLDSYLVAAPLWLLLLSITPVASGV